MRSESGMTVLELVAGLAIMIVATAGLYQLMAHQLRHVARQEAVMERRQEGRAAATLLLRELRLAGVGRTAGPACHPVRDGIEVGPSAVQFLANLHGVATVLAVPAAAGDLALSVPGSGAAFAADDVIYLHDPVEERVECHRLDRDGRAGTILLAVGDPVRRAFPAGSRVQVINLVRYGYMAGTRQLVRSVDGGAQAVADRVADVHFEWQAGRVAATILLEGGAVWPVVAAPRNGRDE